MKEGEKEEHAEPHLWVASTGLGVVQGELSAAARARWRRVVAVGGGPVRRGEGDRAGKLH